MSGPWTFAFDTEGPQNGDVLVKTTKGRLVALIYASGDDEKTLARARQFCRHVSPQWCGNCGKIVPESNGSECADCRILLEAAFTELEAKYRSVVPHNLLVGTTAAGVGVNDLHPPRVVYDVLLPTASPSFATIAKATGAA